MNYQLDEIDKNILDFLVENTRMPFTEIAKQMNVSAGTIHVRVKKMEDAGIIKGSSLILDYGKLDYHFIAFMGILLTKSDKSQEVLNELVSNFFLPYRYQKRSFLTFSHLPRYV